ncbi:DUF6879 family protein [Nocardia sp. XZ_19_385]|uniref:DUF6879 family protein n=1 Tax=Nocardia sp. XZ_19_385 TaxID=2769488 RepID=UPI00188EE04D|nr:DUF6879 family protein [Nocardia sp. XZ_19_385]
MRLLDYEAGTAAVAAATKSALHLELRDSYFTAQEVERLRRFRAGEPDPDLAEWFAPWTRLVSEMTSRGVTMQRLRVITEPLAEYSQWLHSITSYNIDAGEDVRWLGRHRTHPEELPTDDWWLLDDSLVVYSLFGEDDELNGFAATDDPAIAAHFRRVWDQLWPNSTQHEHYRPEVQS